MEWKWIKHLTEGDFVPRAEAEARIKDLEKYCCEVCHIRNVPSECENHCPVKIKRGRS